MNDLESLLKFLHTAEKLKTLLRHSWLSDGRQESVAEHTWRMSLMAIVLRSQLEIPVNLERVLIMIAVHDLAEAYAGDYHAFRKVPDNKHELEQKALEKIVAELERKTKDLILNLWEEFEANKTIEAKFTQALDKLEVLIQHNEADIKTWNEKEYLFNLTYGDDKVKFSKMLSTFRNHVKDECKNKISHAKK